MNCQRRNAQITIRHFRHHSALFLSVVSILPVCSFALVLLWLPRPLWAAPKLLPARPNIRVAQLQASKEQNRQRARELAQKGSAAFANQDYTAAQKYYEDAYALYPANIILYSLGRAYEEGKKWLRAYRAYQQFVDALPPAEQSIQQARDARMSIRIVEAHLGRLKVESDTPALPYRIDDELDFRAGTEPVRLDPGEHRLTARNVEQTVTIKEGEILTVALNPGSEPLQGPAAVTTAAVVVPQSSSDAMHSSGLSTGRRAVAGVLGSLAVMSLGAAIAMTVLDGKEASGQCPFAGAGSLTTCVYDMRIGYPIAYAAAGVLTIGMTLTLTLFRKPSAPAPRIAVH